jgi:hypothetical protein
MKTVVYISELTQMIKVVQGSLAEGKLLVTDCLDTAFPPGEADAAALLRQKADFLRDLWHNHQLPAKEVRLVLGAASLTKRLEVPVIGQKQLLSLIRNEFSGQLAEGADYLFDYQVLAQSRPGGEGGGIILAAALERRLVAEYAALFSEIGVVLESIEVSLNTAVRLFSRAGNALHTFIGAVLEGDDMELFLFVDGLYSFSNKARLVEQRGTPAAAVEISRHLSSMVQFCISRHAEKEISAVLLTGLLPEEMLYCDNMSQSLNVPVGVFEDNGSLLVKTKQAAQRRFCCSEFIYALGGLF